MQKTIDLSNNSTSVIQEQLGKLQSKEVQEEQKQNNENEIMMDKLNQKLMSSKYYKKGEQAENQIIQQLTGLQLNIDVHAFNVYVKSITGQTEWIHTIKCGDNQQDVIVCLHGYGGSSLTYYKMMKPLSQKYKVLCIDCIGCGLSSRPQFNLKDPNEIVDYFCSLLDEWRKFFNLSTFYLAGHSFGGFLASQYALRYPQFIKQLILISPVGVKKITDEENNQFEQQILQNSNFIKRYIFKKIKKSFEAGKGISQMYQCCFTPSSYILKRYLNNRLSLPENEQLLWKEYMDSVLSLPSSYEKSFNYLFKVPKLVPAFPLQEDLPKVPFNVNFFYGENDWMERNTAFNLIQTNQVQGTYQEIKNADHQIVFQNPIDLSMEICKYITEKKAEQKDITKE